MLWVETGIQSEGLKGEHRSRADTHPYCRMHSSDWELDVATEAESPSRNF